MDFRKGYSRWVNFFLGTHTIPTRYIVEKYENDLEEFKNACEQHQGISVNLADTAYSFELAPRIPVLVQFWERDDDFPADSKMLFDQSISDHLTLDAIFGLSVVVCRTIVKNSQGIG